MKKKYSINAKRLVKTFTDLVKIPSPSWEERRVLDYITTELDRIKVPYKKYRCRGSFNLLIKAKGTRKGKPVLLSAHMDTVTPCEGIKPIVTDTKVTSDGTTILGSDDKSAIAMFLEGLRYLKEEDMSHGPIEILISCAEEVGLYGVKEFDLSNIAARHAFVFDSDGPIGKIILKAPYHVTMEIDIMGKAAHAGMEPEKGINAINVLSKIITALPSGRIDKETTANIGTIKGGRATNIVAENAQCSLEFRSINKNKLNKIEALYKKTIKDISSRYGAKSRIMSNLEYSGFTIKPDDKIALIALEAMNRIGVKHEFIISGGGSDTNVLNKSGIKAINLSSGMKKVHTNREYILIKDLKKGTELVLSIIDVM